MLARGCSAETPRWGGGGGPRFTAHPPCPPRHSHGGHGSVSLKRRAPAQSRQAPGELDKYLTPFHSLKRLIRVVFCFPTTLCKQASTDRFYMDTMTVQTMRSRVRPGDAPSLPGRPSAPPPPPFSLRVLTTSWWPKQKLDAGPAGK